MSVRDIGLEPIWSYEGELPSNTESYAGLERDFRTNSPGVSQSDCEARAHWPPAYLRISM
jgi:hypothetical protein